MSEYKDETKSIENSKIQVYTMFRIIKSIVYY